MNKGIQYINGITINKIEFKNWWHILRLNIDKEAFMQQLQNLNWDKAMTKSWKKKEYINLSIRSLGKPKADSNWKIFATHSMAVDTYKKEDSSSQIDAF